MALTDAFTSLINTPLDLPFTADRWTPVAIVRIPKSTSSIVLDKRICPIALTSFGLKLTEHAVQRRFRSSMNPPDDLFQFTYKSNRSTFDTAASLIHHFCKFLSHR